MAADLRNRFHAARMCSVIFEVRRDSLGEYYHLVTAGKATKREMEAYAEQV